MTTSGDPVAAVHLPVLQQRVVDLLAPALTRRDAEERDGGEGSPVLVDATLGLGGHALALLDACPQARLVGIDRDREALELAGRRLAPHADRFVPVHAVFDKLPAVLASLGLHQVAAVLLDLGVSSLQLDRVDRGFAYRMDAPLDMRMDQDGPTTAADVLNTYPESELRRILADYGEERFAGRVAAAIVRERDSQPFTTSARLVDVVRRAVPAVSQRTGGHPAKRTFQALRIEVNGELAVLERALPAAIGCLKVGGRIAVLSYHSLEDRLVKRALTAAATGTTPAGLPVELPEHAAQLRLLTRGAQQPSPQEIRHNSRAASARLRAAERIRPMKGPDR